MKEKNPGFSHREKTQKREDDGWLLYHENLINWEHFTASFGGGCTIKVYLGILCSSTTRSCLLILPMGDI